MELEEQEVLVKWSGREFHFKLVPTSTISQLKLRIQVHVFICTCFTLILNYKQEVTNVLPKNQKLTSASFKGKLPPEDVLLHIPFAAKPLANYFLEGNTIELSSKAQTNFADRNSRGTPRCHQFLILLISSRKIN